jgi:hypothetical protein
MLPNDIAVGFTDGEDVFAIRSADEDEPVFFCEKSEWEKEEKGDEFHEKD